VFKRTWILWMVLLLMAALLSACGQSKLAKNLTPIPTLPPATEPTLVDALQGGTATPAQAASGGQLTQDQLVAMGKDLFSTNCVACHDGAQNGAGPAFVGMADRAATREPGKTAEQYIHESIVDPSAYVVSGFSDIMPKDFATKFSAQEIDALVAYIMADSVTGAAQPTPEGTPQAAPTTEGTAAPTTEATTAPTTEGTAAPTTEATTAPTTEATTAPTTEATTAPAGTATLPPGDPAAGQQLFAANCSFCHGAQNGTGPALTGMGQRAATRIPGVSAADYIHQSIVDPSAYVVSGFPDNVMPKNFGDKFSAQEISDLIAYILTQ
jgi:mono/diheme cytochrome c family protein